MSKWAPGTATHTTPILRGRRRSRLDGWRAALLLGATFWACVALIFYGARELLG